MGFFKLDDTVLEFLADEFLDLDIDTLTPVKALMQLNKIRGKLSQKNN
tara:strand:+ start:286 stop:429 length:144 start_codon:yes stop_codon:yes gene_type:complete